VLIKPNLNGAEGCTDRSLAEALIRILKDLSPRRIFIAESTYGDADVTRMCFRKTGFSELAATYGIDLINLNESEAVEVSVKKPLIAEKIRIAREVFEADKILNLPVMKVHYATGVTLAMKNLKGFLVRDEKIRFHEIGLDKAIADLNSALRTHLNIIDATTVMEKMGPRGGNLFRLNLIFAGEGIAETDWAGMQVMGFGLDEVQHVKLFVAANGIDLGASRVVGESIESVKRPFARAALDNILPARCRVYKRNACSACLNAFLLSCRLLEGKLTSDLSAYLGSAVTGEEIPGSLSLAFGNCVPESVKADFRIRGCPPYPFTLKKVLKEHLL
jgi:uncharacterized protein (DUF362 family)